MPLGSRQAGLLRKEPARKPCVGELGDLENLNKELAEKGGQVVGVLLFVR